VIDMQEFVAQLGKHGIAAVEVHEATSATDAEIVLPPHPDGRALSIQIWMDGQTASLNVYSGEGDDVEMQTVMTSVEPYVITVALTIIYGTAS